MYELPNVDGYYSDKELYIVLHGWGLAPTAIAFIKNAKHVFTHIDWLMKGYAVTVNDESGDFLWVTDDQLQEIYALPTAFQKILP